VVIGSNPITPTNIFKTKSPQGHNPFNIDNNNLDPEEAELFRKLLTYQTEKACPILINIAYRREPTALKPPRKRTKRLTPHPCVIIHDFGIH
jgi:hypothetical protein